MKEKTITDAEAIKILETAKPRIEWNCATEYQEALDIALKALKKQDFIRTTDFYNGSLIMADARVLKKPKRETDSSWGVKKEVYFCPNCDYLIAPVEFLETKEEAKKISYCEHCGQAIEWR